tara:strand:+ start:6684 stop:7352 length:669 start_codon:yes stop_codon:yes gene_type:complete
MDYHKSLDTISIYHFQKIFRRKEDISNIIVNHEKYTEKEKNKFITRNRKDILSTFDKLQNDFSRITFSKQELQREKEKAKLTYLLGKKEILLSSLIAFSQSNEIDFLLVLNEIRGISIKEPITPSTIDYLETQLKGVENKITILKSKLKTKYPELFKDKDKDKKEDVEEQDPNELYLQLDNQALQMELSLETGYSINVKTTNVTRWVNLVKIIKEKFERLNK